MAVSEGEVEMLLEEHGVGGASEHKVAQTISFPDFLSNTDNTHTSGDFYHTDKDEADIAYQRIISFDDHNHSGSCGTEERLAFNW